MNASRPFSCLKGLIYCYSSQRDKNDEEKQTPSPSSKPHYIYSKFSDMTTRRVLKCTLAYFISILFSLYRPLANRLGPAPFLISTGVLYSHPGRTLGAQLDTTITGTAGILSAIIYPLISIAVAVGFQHTSFGSILVCRIIHSLFLVSGIFFAQYLRQIFPKLHYFSLQFMIIQIFVITRDLDYRTIPFQLPLDYGLSLLIGHFISLIVNVLIWPETAVDGLGRALNEATICSKDVLNLITQQFFLDPKSSSLSESEITSVLDEIRVKISKLNTVYREAKYEVSYAHVKPQQMEKVLKSLNRLAKHLNLLGGCLKTERELFESTIMKLKKKDEDTEYDDYDVQLVRAAAHISEDYSNGQYPLGECTLNKSSLSLGSVTTMVQCVEEEEDISSERSSIYSKRPFFHVTSLSFSQQLPPSKTKRQTEFSQRHLLTAYLESLKDPLIELSLICSNTLECVSSSIVADFEIELSGPSKNNAIANDITRHGENQNCNCSQKMRLAIIEFDKAEHSQMHNLYHVNKSRIENSLDFGLRQELFLVFFFINTMREVANELKQMSFELDLIRFQSSKKKQLHMPCMTLKLWNKWARGSYSFTTLLRQTPETIPLKEEIKLMNYTPKRSKSKNSPQAGMPASNENEINRIPWILRIRFELWLRLQYFNKHEFKFSLKLATAVLLLCLPAFFSSSKGWYSDYKGQWAALTVISIMNPTRGGTFDASFWRIIGTVIGALAGWSALEAGNGSPYFLGFFAIILALPFFYIHLTSTYTKVGIVCLITYTVIALGRYVSSVPGESISTTVWKRSLTLITGICVALVLNSAIWPFAAQRMVRKTIACCLEQLEDHYLYLNSQFLYRDTDTALSNLIHAEKLEKKMQSTLNACGSFLELTDHELCFQGPFPKAFYKEIIASMQKLLDHMINIRAVSLQMPVVVKNDICEKEYHTSRKEMMSAILLSLHTLASSLRSKTALPVYMPAARVARNKLMDHRRSTAQMNHWIKFRNLTWFSMAYSTEEIISELEYLFHLIRLVVGENKYAVYAQHVDTFHK